MYFSGNLLKGCVLRLLNDGVLSFQELSTGLNHIEPIGEGTLLAALAELEKSGWICTQLSPDRRTKYYFISDSGEKELAEFRKGWIGFSAAVDSLLRGEVTAREKEATDRALQKSLSEHQMGPLSKEPEI